MRKKILQDRAAVDAGVVREKDVRALEKVFEHLGFDAKQFEHWHHLHDIVLASGFLEQRQKEGRPKGTKKWDFDHLFILGANLHQIELKYPNASDKDLAQQIRDRWPDDYKFENASTFRKRLPEARRCFKDLMKEPGMEQMSSRLLRRLFPAEMLNHDLMQEFREHWPSSAEFMKIVIKAAAPVRRAEERQRRKDRR
jgi:hypothetical protein